MMSLRTNEVSVAIPSGYVILVKALALPRIQRSVSITPVVTGLDLSLQGKGEIGERLLRLLLH
ncbi:MAG: hypothetical protein ACOX6V_04445 [Patescibacteria group bacterium]